MTDDFVMNDVQYLLRYLHRCQMHDFDEYGLFSSNFLNACQDARTHTNRSLVV